MPRQISPEVIGKNEKFLLYGDPGVGKTHCALTSPTPIYYICTGGPDEVQTFYSKRFQNKYGDRIKESDLLIDTVDLTFSWGLGKPDGYDQVKNLIEKAVIAREKGEIDFKTIVVDNMTTLTELQIEKAIFLTDQSRPAESKGKSTKDKFDETGVLQVADFEWKDVMNMMSKFLSELFRVDAHFVIVAHEWEQTVTNRSTKQSDVIAVKPKFIGTQRDLIPNLFSNVWRIYPTGNISSARTELQEQSPSIVAKTRVGGVISRDYVDPDLTKAIEKFKRHAERTSEQGKASS